MKLSDPQANGNGTQGFCPKGNSGEPEYNGWKNRQTWNVSMWLNNDYGIYKAAVQFMEKRKHPKANAHYLRFIKEQGLADERTPDRYKWLSNSLDYKALDDMMRELVA
jgi:hypothetical protein